MKASIRHVLLAVEVGEASLVGESAGYIVLGAADRALVRASVAHASSVFLDPDGQVHLDGTDADAEAVEASLRQLLGELLGRVRTPCPNLERVAGRRQCRGLSTLVTELEAALVPVNRRAARRSLGRLCRDAERSRHLEWTRARVEPVPTQADSHHEASLPAFDTAPSPFPGSYEEPNAGVPVDVALAEPGNVPVEIAEYAPSAAVLPFEPSVTFADDGAVTTLHESAGVEILTSLHAPVHHIASEPSPPPDDEPTRLLSPDVRDVGIEASVREFVHEFVPEAVIDEEPTRLFAAEVRDVPEPLRPLRKVKILGAWRSTGPDLPDDAPLVDVPDSAPPRRPSDVSELLARFGRSEPARVELLEGLRQLAHVEHTPAPPPLDGPLDGELGFASPQTRAG